MQKLLGSRPLLTTEPQLEGVFYVICPDAISRQLPVSEIVLVQKQFSYSWVTDLDTASKSSRRELCFREEKTMCNSYTVILL
jgi:hypothetical protein